MLEFCNKHERIYIYGKGEAQEMLLKFFDMCQVNIYAYVKSFPEETDNHFIYRKAKVEYIDDVLKDNGAGIIVAIPDRYYDSIIPKFRENNFDSFFVMTENNKKSIACLMKPRCREEMQFEISLVDHCNLSCQMCDHYSQLSNEWFVDKTSFKNDIEQMGKIFDHRLGLITLLGGEPTLHPDLNELMEITRHEFPDTEIIVLTNGIKLLDLEKSEKGNFWQVAKDNNIHITVTVYPIKFDYIALEKKAKEYGVSLVHSSNIHANQFTQKPKISDKHTFDLSKSVPRAHCLHCLYFNKFTTLKDGKFYMCPVQAHIDIFNKCFGKNLEYTEGDYLDIYKVKDWHELAEFSSTWSPFCSYCDQQKWGHDSVWKASSKKIEEYV